MCSYTSARDSINLNSNLKNHSAHPLTSLQIYPDSQYLNIRSEKNDSLSPQVWVCASVARVWHYRNLIIIIIIVTLNSLIWNIRVPVAKFPCCRMQLLIYAQKWLGQKWLVAQPCSGQLHSCTHCSCTVICLSLSLSSYLPRDSHTIFLLCWYIQTLTSIPDFHFAVFLYRLSSLSAI